MTGPRSQHALDGHADRRSARRPAAADVSIPGPVDREHFADAQRRHRRARRWYVAVSVLAMLLLGVPLVVVVAPLVVLVAMVGGDLVNIVVPVTDVRDVSFTPTLAAGVVVAAVVPALVVHVVVWSAVRRLFTRAGSGAAFAVGARDPFPGELEERQLANVVHEVAIACGIRVPSIRLIDSDVVNLAVIGVDLDDATVVVTTGLLDTLDRDETQAVVAHAVGSVGNGDLAIGTTIASVLQTTGLMAALLAAPSSAGSRRVLRRLVRCALRPGDDEVRAAAELGELFAYSDPELDDGKRSRVLRIVLLPVALAGGAYALTRRFSMSLLVEPVLRRGWRARKRLADATAVELTRNPDALARAYATLGATAGLPPGATWAAHLFVVGPEAAVAKNTALLHQRLTAAQARGPGGLFGDVEAMTAFAALAEAAKAATFHPPLADRVVALRRLGASAETTAWLPPAPPARSKVVAVLLAPFRLFAFVFQLTVPIYAIGVAVFLGLIYVAPVTMGLHQLLRGWAE